MRFSAAGNIHKAPWLRYRAQSAAELRGYMISVFAQIGEWE
jgi:hypothetical protein